MSTTVNSVKPSKASALAGVRAVIAGTHMHTPNGSLTFGNATYTAASLVQMFQSLVDAMTADPASGATAKEWAKQVGVGPTLALAVLDRLIGELAHVLALVPTGHRASGGAAPAAERLEGLGELEEVSAVAGHGRHGRKRDGAIWELQRIQGRGVQSLSRHSAQDAWIGDPE